MELVHLAKEISTFPIPNWAGLVVPVEPDDHQNNQHHHLGHSYDDWLKHFCFLQIQRSWRGRWASWICWCWYWCSPWLLSQNFEIWGDLHLSNFRIDTRLISRIGKTSLYLTHFFQKYSPDCNLYWYALKSIRHVYTLCSADRGLWGNAFNRFSTLNSAPLAESALLNQQCW